ncbi:MAG TPA: ABC transporter substrate-binding protein [Nannocystaceae bacterium]|nr:ABC transporter substrate-binding protein [Nannocystaceae bacterium]
MRMLFALGFVALACGRTTPHADGPAQRVVSQVVFADEELWELGDEARARVVGVSTMVDDARYSGAAGKWPASVARVAGSEAIVAATPDLVVIAEFTAAETRAVLEELGIRTLLLRGFDGFDDYRVHLRELGAAVGASAAAEARIAAFDRRLSELRVDDASARPGIVSWQEGTVAGSGTIFADEVDAAGLRDLAGEHGITGHQSISLETLVAWDPELIAIGCSDDCARAEADFAARPGIALTRAGKHGGIVGLPAHMLYSTGFGMLDVVARLRERRSTSP